MTLNASGRPEHLPQVACWLRQHGLGDAEPTPLLAARLTVRLRARVLAQLMLAVLIIAASLAQVYNLLLTSETRGLEPLRPAPVLILGGLVAAALVVRTRLDSWVRRVDRQAGAQLARRVTHPLPPGWRALVGRPYTVLAILTYAGAFALGTAALTEDSTRHGAIVLLVAVAGVGVGAVLQLRDLLARPVVAEDQVSLTADVIMRIEDARDSTAPTVLWSLPMVLLSSAGLGWWTAASGAFLLAGVAAHMVINVKSPSCASMAEDVVGAG